MCPPKFIFKTNMLTDYAYSIMYEVSLVIFLQLIELSFYCCRGSLYNLDTSPLQINVLLLLSLSLNGGNFFHCG